MISPNIADTTSIPRPIQDKLNKNDKPVLLQKIAEMIDLNFLIVESEKESDSEYGQEIYNRVFNQSEIALKDYESNYSPKLLKDDTEDFEYI